MAGEIQAQEVVHDPADGDRKGVLLDSISGKLLLNKVGKYSRTAAITAEDITHQWVTDEDDAVVCDSETTQDAAAANGNAEALASPAVEATDTAGTVLEVVRTSGGTKSSAFRGVTLFKPTMKWRAQISASGKTTSLGDHDTEGDAARAFDRAAINKAGAAAKTNFDINDYRDEIADLQAMSQTELVAMLRSRARKSGTQTSHYRGVSLLKQTQKWHAQINVGGKQVHLGFFPTEEQAARAYDRAAINKGALDGGKIITNMDISDYEHELDKLRRISQSHLVDALASEVRRRQTMELLSSGNFAQGEQVFGSGFDAGPEPCGVCSVKEILFKAERTQPKPTQANPLYANFGKRREGDNGEALPLVTRPPNFPPPIERPHQRRPPVRPRALFRRRAYNSSDESSGEEETDEDGDFYAEAGKPQQPTRRSARNAGKAAKHYSENSGLEGLEEEDGEASESDDQDRLPKASPKRTPKQTGIVGEWGSTSPPFRQRRKGCKAAADSDSEACEDRKKKEGRKAKDDVPAEVRPAEEPSFDFVAYAVAAARQAGGATPPEQLEPGPNNGVTSGAQVPSADLLPRFNSTATAGSRATANILDPFVVRPATADKGSQAILGQLQPRDNTSVVTVEPAGATPRGNSESPPAKAEQGTPSVVQQPTQQPSPTPPRQQAGPGSHGIANGGSFGEKDSVATGALRDKGSTLAGLGGPLGDKLSDAGFAVPHAVQTAEPASVKGASPDEGRWASKPTPPTPTTTALAVTGKRVPMKKGVKRKDGLPGHEAAPYKKPRGKPAPAVSDDEILKPPPGKPLTKRQKAMLERQQQRRGKAVSQSSPQDSRDPSPKSSYAANLQPSPRSSVAVNQGVQLFNISEAQERQRLQEDAASQSSPQVRMGRTANDKPLISSSDDSHGPKQQAAEDKVGDASSSEELGDSVPRGANRRKRRQPARSAI